MIFPSIAVRDAYQHQSANAGPPITGQPKTNGLQSTPQQDAIVAKYGKYLNKFPPFMVLGSFINPGWWNDEATQSQEVKDAYQQMIKELGGTAPVWGANSDKFGFSAWKNPYQPAWALAEQSKSITATSPEVNQKPPTVEAPSGIDKMNSGKWWQGADMSSPASLFESWKKQKEAQKPSASQTTPVLESAKAPTPPKLPLPKSPVNREYDLNSLTGIYSRPAFRKRSLF